MMQTTCCSKCAQRAWLLGELSSYLDHAHVPASELPELFTLEDRELILALTRNKSNIFLERLASFEPAEITQPAAKLGAWLICQHDDHYPKRLRELPGMPRTLFVRGERTAFNLVTAEPAVAIVGSRRASNYGLSVARSLASALTLAGVPVISGMALGVDSAAHCGALEGSGVTAAVMACGIDIVYPKSKRLLHEQICTAGCVISELPIGTAPRRYAFPARNRIIAGLADVTVVVEAAERSGSLITAAFARDFGREVGAVPGQTTNINAKGANALLKDGAALVSGVEDVLDLLFGVGVRKAVGKEERESEKLGSDLGDLLDAVSRGCQTVAELSASGFPVDQTLSGLAQLELLGKIRCGPGGQYLPA